MDTLKFLQRVLPSTGVYVVTVINGEQRQQGYFNTIEELAKACVKLDQANNNTYFAISSFLERGNRKQDNVRATKLIAIDVDCGDTKPYADWKVGLTELGKFIADLKLPKPMIVFSGNGLHVYWVLTEELEPEQWRPIANAMKLAFTDRGFEADPVVTGDIARILRPVGTRNPKNGNEVKLLVDADPVSPDTLRSALAVYLQAQPASLPSHTRTNSLLGDLAVKQEFPPAVGAVVANKCQQIKSALEKPDKVDEPLWYNIIGVAAHCVDPEATAILWSKGHPTYSERATLAKLNHWRDSTTGPTTCKKFNDENPSGCKGCKFKDKIGSPVRLGTQYQEVAPPDEVKDKTAHMVPMPRPFKRTADGIKMTIDETDIDVCKFDVYPVGYGMDESLGYETVRYHWNRLHMGWQDLVLRQAYLADGSREFATAIADQGIVLNGKKQTEYFQLMLRSYMDELRQIRAVTNLYSTMGWKENNTSFVLGDHIFKKASDGSVTEEQINLSSGIQRQGAEMYTTKGSLEKWVEMTRIMEKATLPHFMFTLGVGLSAPFYHFTGLKGLTVSLYGETGAGKTLAQIWAQSIFGNPDKLHFTAKYTQNSLFSRLGVYSNLPLTIDEATMMNDKEVGDFCYWVSQGRDKARLNRNAEERDAKTWATPVIVSTNKSLAGKLIASGLDTDAQMARLLELSVYPHQLFTKDTTAGKMIYGALNENYGVAGKVFIYKLMELGEDGIRAVIADAAESFSKRYKCKFSGQERYWEQAIMLADLALRLAHQWGLIKFNYETGIEWVLSQIGAIRRTVQENKQTWSTLVSEYMADCAGSTVTVMHTAGQQPQPDYSRIPRSDVRIRIDVFRKSAAEPFDRGTMLFDRTHFRKWLSARGADYKSLKEELTVENVVATPKSEKASLGKDTPIRLSQTYVVGFNLSHPELLGVLENADMNADELTFGQMQVVK